VLHSAVVPLTMVAKHEEEAAQAPLLAPIQVPAEQSELSAALVLPEGEEPEPPEPPFFIYTVQEGDTVASLAAQFGITAESILWNNLDLEDEDFLSLGQKIRIPTSDGIIYEVRLGDTLSDIAGYFGVDVQDVLDFPANGLSSADDIVENQTVFVPNGVLPVPVHSEPIAEEDTPTSVVEPAEPSSPPVVERPPSATGFIWPVVGPISSYFGPSHPLGIDIDQFHSPGAPVLASAAGTVTFAGGNACCSYGLYVVINHGNGFETLYAHLDPIAVVQGQQVAQGEVIGYVGLTGYTTGYHLHFEVRLNGQYVNPLNYLP
jgi:murein DD-endopeptidase MepM/ murein hydrolase activator NlpD